VGGKPRLRSLETEDKAEARLRVDALEAQERAAGAEAPGEITIEAFARGEWLELRRTAKPLAWRDDLSRFAHHFFPEFGNRPLSWLATEEGGRAVFSWAVGLRRHLAKRDRKPLAPRSVWNIYSSVKVLLDDAVDLKRLARSPLEGFRTDKYLPTKEDKAEGWRESAGFELEQVVALTTDERLAPWRRVWNTIAFMAGGARTGEIANLRWRDWTPDYRNGSGRITIASAFNSREKIEKGTKTGAKKYIPVHSFVRAVLEQWHETGWLEFMGRAPRADDFILPRLDGRQWGNGQLLALFHSDLDALGIPRQRQYENRSTFRNLLLRAGAPEFIVNLMTHPSPKQASDAYTRVEMQWPAMCEAIKLLDDPAWRTDGAVTALVTAYPCTKKNAPGHEGLARFHFSRMYGYSNRVAGSNVSLMARIDTQRIRFAAEPALSFVPEARAPPNGCCPTTAPVGLSFT
jgi:integrase